MIIRINHQILADLPMPEIHDINMSDECDIVFDTITYYNADYLNGVVKDIIKEIIEWSTVAIILK